MQAKNIKFYITQKNNTNVISNLTYGINDESLLTNIKDVEYKKLENTLLIDFNKYGLNHNPFSSNSLIQGFYGENDIFKQLFNLKSLEENQKDFRFNFFGTNKQGEEEIKISFNYTLNYADISKFYNFKTNTFSFIDLFIRAGMFDISNLDSSNDITLGLLSDTDFLKDKKEVKLSELLVSLYTTFNEKIAGKFFYSFLLKTVNFINLRFAEYLKINFDNLYYSGYSMSLKHKFLEIMEDKKINIFSKINFDTKRVKSTQKWQFEGKFTSKNDKKLENELKTKLPKISKYLQHVFSNEDIYDTENYWINFIRCLSFKYNNLYKRIPFGIILTGLGGTGKSTLAEYIIKKSLLPDGSQYATILDNKINDNFNESYVDKVITSMDEFKNFKDLNDKLKPIITSDYLIKNGKGDKEYQVINMNWVIVTTNKPISDVLVDEVEGRRYLVRNFTNWHQKNKVSILGDGGNGENNTDFSAFVKEIPILTSIIANKDYWLTDDYIPSLADFTGVNQMIQNKIKSTNKIIFHVLFKCILDELNSYGFPQVVEKDTNNDFITLDPNYVQNMQKKFTIVINTRSAYFINIFINTYKELNPNVYNEVFTQTAMNHKVVHNLGLSKSDDMFTLLSADDYNQKNGCFYNKNKKQYKLSFDSIDEAKNLITKWYNILESVND